MTDSAKIEARLGPEPVHRVALGEWAMLAGFVLLGLFVHQQILGPLTAAGHADGDPVNNAALFPRLVANLILGLCGLQLIQLLRRRVLLSDEFRLKARRGTIARGLAGLGLLVAYLLALPMAGFHAATMVFLFSLFALLKARPLWIAALVAVLMTLAVGYVFEELLRVVLPQARLGLLS